MVAPPQLLLRKGNLPAVAVGLSTSTGTMTMQTQMRREARTVLRPPCSLRRGVTSVQVQALTLTLAQALAFRQTLALALT